MNKTRRFASQLFDFVRPPEAKPPRWTAGIWRSRCAFGGLNHAFFGIASRVEIGIDWPDCVATHSGTRWLPQLTRVGSASFLDATCRTSEAPVIAMKLMGSSEGSAERGSRALRAGPSTDRRGPPSMKALVISLTYVPFNPSCEAFAASAPQRKGEGMSASMRPRECSIQVMSQVDNHLRGASERMV